jgi:type IV pilus assembly protein PilO
MDLNQINELDFNTIGEWPIPVKLILIGILCAAVWGATYYFDTMDQLEQLAKVERQEPELKKTFETEQKRASKLEAYEQQLAEMNESFGAMLRQLPNKTEVDALLVDVSQTGLAAGLEFELFRPEGEAPKDFYAELPISIRVVGTFHQFGNFISGLATLPRIVTIHNVTITPQGQGVSTDKQVKLLLEATAKTYRYMDEKRK